MLSARSLKQGCSAKGCKVHSKTSLASPALRPAAHSEWAAHRASTKTSSPFGPQIGRAHVCTPVTNAHLVCRLLLVKKKQDVDTFTHIIASKAVNMSHDDIHINSSTRANK